MGAHPDDDQLENATKESAEQVLHFLELIIEEFYGSQDSREVARQRTGASPTI